MSAERTVLLPCFFRRTNVVGIARELLGKVIVTEWDDKRTSGIITETEAYAGIGDRASHAFGGKRTTRNEPMYAAGGIAYVYLCYGIHHLFNVVTNDKDVPHAVLLRAIDPLEGLTHMKKRRGSEMLNTTGPGTLTQALGIRTTHSGTHLGSGPIRLEDHGILAPDLHINVGPRIGIDYAGTDALLPYRFWIAPSHLVTPNK